MAHTDTNRKFAAEKHSRVKQFDKEDILARFKRADSTTTYVAVLAFLSASTILKNFVAPVDKHLPRNFNLLCRMLSFHCKILTVGLVDVVDHVVVDNA